MLPSFAHRRVVLVNIVIHSLDTIHQMCPLSAIDKTNNNRIPICSFDFVHGEEERENQLQPLIECKNVRAWIASIDSRIEVTNMPKASELFDVFDALCCARLGIVGIRDDMETTPEQRPSYNLLLLLVELHNSTYSSTRVQKGRGGGWGVREGVASRLVPSLCTSVLPHRLSRSFCARPTCQRNSEWKERKLKMNIFWYAPIIVQAHLCTSRLHNCAKIHDQNWKVSRKFEWRTKNSRGSGCSLKRICMISILRIQN